MRTVGCPAGVIASQRAPRPASDVLPPVAMKCKATRLVGKCSFGFPFCVDPGSGSCFCEGYFQSALSRNVKVYGLEIQDRTVCKGCPYVLLDGGVRVGGMSENMECERFDGAHGSVMLMTRESLRVWRSNRLHIRLLISYQMQLATRSHIISIPRIFWVRCTNQARCVTFVPRPVVACG